MAEHDTQSQRKLWMIQPFLASHEHEAFGTLERESQLLLSLTAARVNFFTITFTEHTKQKITQHPT